MSFATADERYFVRLVNNTRKEMGLEPLKIAKPLNEAADGHTQWMLDTGAFSHAPERAGHAPQSALRKPVFLWSVKAGARGKT